MNDLVAGFLKFRETARHQTPVRRAPECLVMRADLPPSERRKRPAAPMESASPALSSEIPPAKAFAINTGLSAKTSTAAIASPSSPITAVSSSLLRWR
jgi:hypothetical protein